MDESVSPIAGFDINGPDNATDAGSVDAPFDWLKEQRQHDTGPNPIAEKAEDKNHANPGGQKYLKSRHLLNF